MKCTCEGPFVGQSAHSACGVNLPSVPLKREPKRSETSLIYSLFNLFSTSSRLSAVVLVFGVRASRTGPHGSHHVSFLLAAQRHHVLGGWGEQPHGLSGGSVVAVVENQGLLDCEEGNGPVPHVGAGHPGVELALQCRAESHHFVWALPLQSHHLTQTEQRRWETSHKCWIYWQMFDRLHTSTTSGAILRHFSQ